MEHIQKAKEIKKDYIKNSDHINTSVLILDYFVEQYNKNNLDNLDNFIYFFLTDDFNKKIKHNIHVSICFMKESEFLNKIINKFYNHLNNIK